MGVRVRSRALAKVDIQNWPGRSKASEALLVLPVEGQGLSHQTLQGQVNGLGTIEDGALDFG